MTNSLLKKGLMGALIVVLGSSMPAASTLPRFFYAITDLEPLSRFTNSEATSINDLGQVVGTSALRSGLTHAVLWNNGKITNLGTLGGKSSYVSGINNKGQVVGYSETSTGDQHAFLWQNGSITDLGGGQALGINNAGQVVGRSFLWQNGKMSGLSISPAINYPFQIIVLASDINNKGQIVGITALVGQASPFKASIDGNGTVTEVAILYSSNIPYGFNNNPKINQKGQVIFSIGVNSLTGPSPAYLGSTNLGYLGGTQYSTYSRANDINDAGTVIGSSSTDSGKGHAFIWRNGKMTDLNNLLPPQSGWELTSANGLNNRGQIVGTGIHNGNSRAFLLTPTVVFN